MWKNGCDKVFRNSSVNCQVLACRAMAHVLEFSCIPASHDGKKLLLNNFSHADGSFLFISSSWNAANEVSGAGFFCSNSNYSISFGGSCPILARDAADAKILALQVAIESAISLGHPIRHLFLSNEEAYKSTILHFFGDDILHFGSQSLNHNLNQILISANNPRIHIIPKSWASPAYKLAIHGVNLRCLALFLQGRELPYWMMKHFKCSGLISSSFLLCFAFRCSLFFVLLFCSLYPIFFSIK